VYQDDESENQSEIKEQLNRLLRNEYSEASKKEIPNSASSAFSLNNSEKP